MILSFVVSAPIQTHQLVRYVEFFSLRWITCDFYYSLGLLFFYDLRITLGHIQASKSVLEVAESLQTHCFIVR